MLLEEHKACVAWHQHNPHAEENEDFCLLTMQLWFSKSDFPLDNVISTNPLVLTLQDACARPTSRL